MRIDIVTIFPDYFGPIDADGQVGRVRPARRLADRQGRRARRYRLPRPRPAALDHRRASRGRRLPLRRRPRHGHEARRLGRGPRRRARRGGRRRGPPRSRRGTRRRPTATAPGGGPPRGWWCPRPAGCRSPRSWRPPTRPSATWCSRAGGTRGSTRGWWPTPGRGWSWTRSASATTCWPGERPRSP